MGSVRAPPRAYRPRHLVAFEFSRRTRTRHGHSVVYLISMHIKKGMVFGVFDGLHEGHQYFLKKAAEMCEKLVVVVARDKAAHTLKGHAPKRTEQKRLAAIQLFNPQWTAFLGDTEAGEWKILKMENPDRVFLGYDQKEMRGELKKLEIPFESIEAHEPERFKSGLLNKQD